MVIERAGMLLGKKSNELSGYEIFFLLLAIHFHDVGNIYGREKHEEKIEEVFEALGDKLPLDNAAKYVILLIATAHGGNIDGNKDTIAHLKEVEYIDSLPVRVSMLAAVLRFSDEIADDKNRTSVFLIESEAIPDPNFAFHMYSKCLEPPVFKGDAMLLMYCIPYEYTQKKVKKNNEDVYLYDEILSRLQKCLCELDYCKKYSQGFIRLSSISVHIAVKKENKLKSMYDVDFRLRLIGYPSINLYQPLSNCAESKIEIENGEKLAQLIGGQENDSKKSVYNN